MTEREKKRQREALTPIFRVAAGFLMVGVILFFHVWWPIQAERSTVLLKHVETELSQKKADLHLLQERYASLTSLAALDQWAKKNGPWKSPSADDVIPFDE